MNKKHLSSAGSVTRTLRQLASRNRKKLCFTFFLVIAENVTYLMYPVLAGIAINAILAGNALNAALYGLMILFIWLLGAVRRSVDTRTFARIYAGLAVSVVLAQRRYQLNHSTIAARVTLSREFVDFFEMHLPMLMTSLISLFGAAIMLLLIEFQAGAMCIAIVIVLGCFLPGYARKNERLFNRLNNRLEKEVAFVQGASQSSLSRHYSTLARLRIRLSDREALGYLSIGALVALMFTLVMTQMTASAGIDAGHIYSVMTYMWMFATSLDDGPQLIEKFSQLKDIGKRVATDEDENSGQSASL